MTRFRRLFLFFLFTFAVSGSAFAQTLAGRVLDPDARAVTGADVIISRNGVVIVSLKTMADGRYGPIEVPSGEYDVSAAASGMHAAPSHVVVQESQTATTDVHMQARDEFGGRADARSHVHEPSAADDAKRHRIESAQNVNLGAHFIRHQRVGWRRRDIRKRAIVVGQQQRVPVCDPVRDFGGHAVRPVKCSTSRSSQTETQDLSAARVDREYRRPTPERHGRRPFASAPACPSDR